MTANTLKSLYRVAPLRALRAVRALIANKEDTTQVFEIMRALSGRAIPNGYQRLLETVEGGRIAFEAEELQPILDDHETLSRLPEGSVGRAYLAFVEGQGFTAEGLAEESRKTKDTEIDAAHPYAWYARRLRDVHDIWHILTGYGRDALGEGCNVAFSYAQTRSSGFALIAFAAANELSRALPGRPVRKAVWQAYQNGRRAAWLPGLDYKALLAEDLNAARERLNIPRPGYYTAIPETERDGGFVQGQPIAAE
jgi:ubiquinone biosynthesis protein COQ4